MIFWNYTSAQFAENLAIDEWLQTQAEAGSRTRSAGSDVSQESHESADKEILRVWRPETYAVVIGRGSRWEDEVRHDECTRREVAVYRRHSGGAAIVAGPGCWMYAVLLDLRRREELRDLTQAHKFIMDRMAAAAQALVPQVEVQVRGTCDLTVEGKKCSGNSLRVTRDWLLYHGTLLVDFDLGRLADCLGTPPRQPEYRAGRTHQDFVTNLPWSRTTESPDSLWLRWHAVLCQQWQADSNPASQALPTVEIDKIQQLVTEKYDNPAWTRTR